MATALAQVTGKLLAAESGVETARAKPKGSDSLKEMYATHETVQGPVARIHGISKEHLQINKIKSNDSVEHIDKGTSQKRKTREPMNVGKDVQLR